MRWLIVSSQHHPTHGGIGTYVSHFCKAAVDAGWHVELVTRPSDLHPPGVTVHEVSTPDSGNDFTLRLPALRQLELVRPFRYALWSLAAAEKLLQLQDEFDAVEFVDTQAEGFVSLTSNRVRSHLREIAGPAIVHAHTPMFIEERINGADLARFGRSIYHGWERQAIASADGVMTASDLLRRELPMAKRSTVIAYPIPSKVVPRHSSPHGQGRGEDLVMVGSIQPRKSVDIWALSLNRVLREFPEVNAVLIGPDTPTATDGGSMLEHVQRLLDDRVADRFKWHGPLSHDAAMEHIRGAAMVVVPSRFDNSPFVVSEALASGTPVVVSDRVGWTEHIPGIPTVQTGDVDGLAEAQIEILQKPARAHQRADECANVMFTACDPIQHLRQGMEFVESLRGCELQFNQAADDTLDSIRAFLESVEQAERSMLASSSAGS